VTIQRNTTTRTPIWENEPPAEPRVRRVQQSVPSPGRASTGIFSEMEDLGVEATPRSNGSRPGGQQTDEPRLDLQRSPARRPASPVLRVFLLLAALVVLGGLGASAWILSDYLARDARFRINGTSDIEATGLTEVSRAQMLPVFSDDIGRNIFFLPLGERRRQLEEIPWIEKATVMRLLPARIRISVVERQPVAFVLQPDGQTGLVDSNGVLLAMPASMMAQHHYSFPVVTGINAHDSPAARRSRMAVYQRLLAELDSNGQRISAQISEINLTDPADAQVLMPEQGGDILAHFGQDRFLERYQRYRAHIAEWRQKYPKLAAVDLRYDQQVVLQMTPGASVAQAAADQQTAVSGGAEQDKTSPADAMEEASGATGIKPALAPQGAGGGSATGQPEDKVKPAKLPVKVSSKTAAKPKTAPEAAKVKARARKRADARRAALNTSRRKTALTNTQAPSARIGQ